MRLASQGLDLIGTKEHPSALLLPGLRDIAQLARERYSEWGILLELHEEVHALSPRLKVVGGV